MTTTIDYDELAQAELKLIALSDDVGEIADTSFSFALGYDTLNSGANNFHEKSATQTKQYAAKIDELAASISRTKSQFKGLDDEAGVKLQHSDNIFAGVKEMFRR